MENSYMYPDCFARFYDIINEKRRSEVDRGFYSKYIKDCKGPILDIGVGTGRIFVDALNNGADIYGIDTSENMLDVLRNKMFKKTHFRISRQNAIDFSFNNKFELIIAPFRLLMHIVHVEDQIKMLRNIKTHLIDNGKFIFDVFIPDLKHLYEGYRNLINYEGEYIPGKKIRRYVSSRANLIEQIMHVTFRFEWEENNDVKNETWQLPMRYFFRYELEHLLTISGFSKIKLIGDFMENEINEKSEDFIFICEK